MYGFVGNDGLNEWDFLGLIIVNEAPSIPVSIDESSGKCIDRAGQQCCCKDVVAITLYQIYPLQEGHPVGHAFMLVDGKVYGHYPDKKNGNNGLGGRGINNPESWDDGNLKACNDPLNPLRCIKKTVLMCPKSLKNTKQIIAQKINDKYCIVNPRSSPTCKGWVDQVMERAGFPSAFTKGWVPTWGDRNQ